MRKLVTGKCRDSWGEQPVGKRGTDQGVRSKACVSRLSARGIRARSRGDAALPKSLLGIYAPPDRAES